MMRFSFILMNFPTCIFELSNITFLSLIIGFSVTRGELGERGGAQSQFQPPTIQTDQATFLRAAGT
jgi:hypothetical protein